MPMINEQASDKEFHSKPYIRRLERERRQRENETLFRSFSAESKQIQDDIYYNVFTEEGQELLLLTVLDHKKNVDTQKMNNLLKKKPLLGEKVNDILSQVVEIVAPKMERKKIDQKDKLFPTGNVTFLEIGPIGIAGKKFNIATQTTISTQKRDTNPRIAIEIRKRIQRFMMFVQR